MTFQTIVLNIATIALILSLIVVFMMLVSDKKSIAYPPIISDCPDYWNIAESGKCVWNSVLSGNMSTSCKEQSFDTPKYKGTNGKCEKQKWANRCKISWDGITNKKVC